MFSNLSSNSISLATVFGNRRRSPRFFEDDISSFRTQGTTTASAVKASYPVQHRFTGFHVIFYKFSHLVLTSILVLYDDTKYVILAHDKVFFTLNFYLSTRIFAE